MPAFWLYSFLRSSKWTPQVTWSAVAWWPGIQYICVSRVKPGTFLKRKRAIRWRGMALLQNPRVFLILLLCFSTSSDSFLICYQHSCTEYPGSEEMVPLLLPCSPDQQEVFSNSDHLSSLSCSQTSKRSTKHSFCVCFTGRWCKI